MISSCDSTFLRGVDFAVISSTMAAMCGLVATQLFIKSDSKMVPIVSLPFFFSTGSDSVFLSSCFGTGVTLSTVSLCCDLTSASLSTGSLVQSRGWWETCFSSCCCPGTDGFKEVSSPTCETSACFWGTSTFGSTCCSRTIDLSEVFTPTCEASACSRTLWIKYVCNGNQETQS